MSFQRPQPSRPLDKEERTGLLKAYLNHYREAAKQDPTVLNRKITRKAFDDILHIIGCLLLEHSAALAGQPGPVRDFLTENPLPEPLGGLLPDNFRAYCLALNALKQWMAAEQAATDRYLLGGRAREECREAAVTCVVTGEPLDAEKVELHHPVRDGRPPVILSKKGHDRLEGQSAVPEADETRWKISAIKREGNRSWVHLRKGCLDLLGREVTHSTANVAASSKSFVRKVSQETGLLPQQILTWLDANGL